MPQERLRHSSNLVIATNQRRVRCDALAFAGLLSCLVMAAFISGPSGVNRVAASGGLLLTPIWYIWAGVFLRPSGAAQPARSMSVLRVAHA